MLQTTDHLGNGSQARISWISPLLVLIAAGLFFCINLDDGIGIHDEFYHLLAARGLLESGRPAIFEGEYTRGLLFTYIVSWVTGLLGDNLGVARLPSAISMALTSMVLFIWVRRAAGPAAAWFSVVLFTVSPFAVIAAQYVRFYALQTLAFTMFCWLVYEAVLSHASPARRMLLAALSLPFLALAANLQPTTFLGLVGVAAWVAGAILLPFLINPKFSLALKRSVVAALLLAGLAVLGIGVATGLLQKVWEVFRATPYFNAPMRNNFLYYHTWYALFYPSFWPAIGIFSAIALARRPQIASFAITVFAVSFILNSIAGSKELRYIAYAQAFMFVIIGTALAVVAGELRGFLSRIHRELCRTLPFPPVLGRRTATTILALALIAMLLANPFWLRTATLLADITLPGEEPDTQMPLAIEELAPVIARSDIVIVAEELQYLYYFGRFDVQFSTTKFAELPDDRMHPFGRDVRTGLPVIDDLTSLNLLLDCYRTGLASAPERRWNNRAAFSREATELIISKTHTMMLPPASHVRAYTWDHGPNWTPPARCSRLNGLGLPPYGDDS
ncbi:MAG: glycosyltransferase family 39 protein [Geminicoccaceae bacterium]|nr:glycosyltransferase family 39 protein [Geminicoccaceae bacterium]